MPVQQGGGPSQQTNKIHIGWGRLSEEDPYRVLVSVDSGESLPIATGENTIFSAATMKFTNSGVTVSGGATANLTVNLYKFGRIVFASMDNYPVYFAAANQGYGNTNSMPESYRPISMVRIAAPSWSSNAAVGTVHVTVQTNGQIVLASTRTAVQEAAWSACWISAT